MIIVIILFVLIGFIFVLGRAYKSPYTLNFIFGKKGAGKTLYMVKLMKRDIKRGWTVYTDISDVNIAGVRIIDSSDLSQFVPAPHSSVFLDEVGITMDNRNFKSFPPGLRDFFKLQRKYKCKVTMNSQAYDVDKKVRDVVDGMALLTDLFGVFTLVRPIVRRVALVEASANGDSRIADNLKFAGILNWQIIIKPLYFKYFNTNEAPEREPIPFTEVVKELNITPEQAIERSYDEDEF